MKTIIVSHDPSDSTTSARILDGEISPKQAMDIFSAIPSNPNKVIAIHHINGTIHIW